MVDFKSLIAPVYVTDDNGKRVNIDEVKDKSITNLFSALRLLEENPPVITKSRELRVLSDELIFKLLVRYQTIIAKDFIKHEGSWGITYNQQFLFYVDSLLLRSSHVFKQFNTVYSLKSNNEFRSKVNLSFFGAIITINDKEYTLNEIDKALKLIAMGQSARTNSAGNKALIYNYTDKDFIRALENACQYIHLDTNIFSAPFIMIEFIERFGFVEYLEEVFIW